MGSIQVIQHGMCMGGDSFAPADERPRPTSERPTVSTVRSGSKRGGVCMYCTYGKDLQLGAWLIRGEGLATGRQHTTTHTANPSSARITRMLVSTVTTAAAALLFSGAVLAAPADPAPKQHSCRCLASDSSCWPKAADFARLNATVSGRLISIAPAAAVCYPSSANFNAAQCASLRANSTNPYFRGDIPGATMHLNHAGDANEVNVCPLDNTLTGTCGQGRVPVVGIEAKTKNDIKAAVNFARKNNLRLVVKNTGHDYFGRSSGAGSFLLWTHHMRGMDFHESFVPRKCRKNVGSAVTIQAGEQWANVYPAAEARGLAVIGGEARTVGSVGGYLQGGGHSPISRTFGLAADNAIEFSVITANGNEVIANECQNTDLFWALRGGGGGTFGVVASATVKTHPSPKTGAAIGSISSAGAADPRAAGKALLQRLIDIQPALDKAGVSGYYSLTPVSVLYILYHPNGTNATIAEALKPLTEFVASSNGTYAQGGATVSFPTYYSAYNFLSCRTWPQTCTDTVGTSLALGSRLIPTTTFTDPVASKQLGGALSDILTQMGSTPFMLAQLVAGGKVAQQDPDALGLNPAWRKALWHVVITKGWTDAAPAAEIATAKAEVTRLTQLMRDVTPGSGAYFNEADANEPNYRDAFFGNHYAKLLSIKNQYDPTGLFVCKKCVGSEGWTDDGNCRA
ncbi:uncharacterized protein EV422DRAFT_518598 [Fimicolochytrium jonesii]|uniref:uncharacterized protein n=1 Tax=Fimicolochytrium jonesii TaxID=1396493 RepID=UPI0022FE2518|nr:uncharacterized protein EV422DRAFT_518598 [Fimicolochytrium jonesii]KAI8824010.1 hypothetical protein EV422DRAFT_518598 [Fimicolochytrium jonesii]